MTMVTIKSSQNYSLSPSVTSENNNLRDPSFSSYLSGAEESFVLKLSGSTQKLSPILMTTQENHHHIFVGNKKKVEEVGEIGVFDAKKYFNEKMDENQDSNTPSNTKSKRHDHVPSQEPIMKPKLQTPSVRSEASWNSQSALLNQSALRNNSTRVKTTNKVHGKSFFASLGCKCACGDKDIDTHEHDTKSTITKHPPQKTGIDSIDVSQITKPLSQTWNKGTLVNPNMPMEKVRKSLEVFGSPIWEKRNTSLSSNDRKVSMFNKKIEEMNVKNQAQSHEDSDSDASSDLFEIDSFTGRANFMMSPATTDYAPSEASIQWSVVTASAADFAADTDEFRPMAKNGVVHKDLVPRRKPSTLLGCKSHKAVRVVGDAYRKSENNGSVSKRGLQANRAH